VTACASELAGLLNFSPADSRLVKVAGKLHDVGKLAIPNAILEKPGRLTKEEFAVIKSHVYHTYTTLRAIAGLEDVADWAAFHHERLDGKGYPFRNGAEGLDIGARLMAVADVFTALAEDRPYREGMSGSEVRKILVDMVDKRHIDGDINNQLLKNYDQVEGRVRAEQSRARERYGRVGKGSSPQFTI